MQKWREKELGMRTDRHEVCSWFFHLSGTNSRKVSTGPLAMLILAGRRIRKEARRRRNAPAIREAADKKWRKKGSKKANLVDKEAKSDEQMMCGEQRDKTPASRHGKWKAEVLSFSFSSSSSFVSSSLSFL